MQVDFAKLVKRPQSVISQWENGRVTPGLETLFGLEERLGLPPGTLAFKAGYFTAEAIEAATTGALADPGRAEVRSLVFAERNEALAAVRSADVLGFAVRLERTAGGAGLPVSWKVEVSTAASTAQPR